LIADDRRPTRQGLRALLTLFPQVEIVGEARDGRESVQLAAAQRPDVVLMDLHMPVMDGLQATRRIKNQWPQVKIVVLTMYAWHQAEALAAGSDVFLLKGCKVEALQAAIMPFNC
jgi:DNA-binding NarL/FixJ family response regulator